MINALLHLTHTVYIKNFLQAYASEICRKEYQALGMSIISTAWGIALVIGPALGGFLAQPAEKFPDVFSKESLFGRFPYFLPCLFISIIALVITILCFWLPEKLPEKLETVGAFQKLPMVMQSFDILYSAIKKAKRVSPTKGNCFGWFLVDITAHKGIRWNIGS
ncbi:protein ZINC INDUCED FACILITATOR 1-like [Humulus lupulus]|uniref:protein ZINC INDUCED FACILITATOR 1-like n=1 Tax=Humulus lupulus TaxID=3486 RepID=UPI002B4069CC|nr:protein ZINC INDUCED FACILITATOR 1-like [Humulus lupulus]